MLGQGPEGLWAPHPWGCSIPAVLPGAAALLSAEVSAPGHSQLRMWIFVSFMPLTARSTERFTPAAVL